MGYGPQKQMALAATSNDWVLLLDADEALSLELQNEIKQLLLEGPSADGYDIPRQEQLFWRMYHPATRMNHFLRLLDKITAYSTGLVADKAKRERWGIPLIMIFYPPLFFIRSYVFKRNFLNGWAGFINSAVAAFYVFLKYAKLYEHYQFARHGSRLFPEGAPPLPAARRD